MQQIFYDGAAYAIVAYPYQLEAFNTAKWQGWVHTPGDAPGGQEGSVIYNYNNIDTYRFVEPKVAAAAAEDQPLVNWKWLAVGIGRRDRHDRHHVPADPGVRQPAPGRGLIGVALLSGERARRAPPPTD